MKTISTLFISFLLTVNLTVNATNVESNSLSLGATTALAAETNENVVVLNWSAKNQAGKSSFEIERSFYSNDFTTIATLQTSFVNNGTNNYRINDNAAELAGRTIAYYRVKQVAANGAISYSNVMIVNLNGDNSIEIKKNTSIRFSATQNGNAVITVKNVTGQTVKTINAIISRGNNNVELTNTNDLIKGMYVSEVSVNGVVVDNQKIVVE